MSTLTVKPLYKSTIIIWTEYDPKGLELTELAYQVLARIRKRGFLITRRLGGESFLN
jgi:hypothetical protein